MEKKNWRKKTGKNREKIERKIGKKTGIPKPDL